MKGLRNILKPKETLPSPKAERDYKVPATSLESDDDKDKFEIESNNCP